MDIRDAGMQVWKNGSEEVAIGRVDQSMYLSSQGIYMR